MISPSVVSKKSAKKKRVSISSPPDKLSQVQSIESEREEDDWKLYYVVNGQKEFCIFEGPNSDTSIGTLEPGQSVYAKPKSKAIDVDGFKVLELKTGGVVEMKLLAENPAGFATPTIAADITTPSLKSSIAAPISAATSLNSQEADPEKLGRSAVETNDGFVIVDSMRESKYSVQVKIEIDEHGDSDPELLKNARVLKNRFCTYTKRMSTLRIYEIALLVWEHEQLVKKANIGLRSAQVICWRRTMLEVSTWFYLANVVFAVGSVMRAAKGDYDDFGDGKVFGMELGDYAPHFKGFVALEYVFQVFTLAGHFFAFCCILVAVMRWRRWTRSLRMTSWAYSIGYVTPFILLLTIPFHWGIDIRGLQQQFCRDVINGAPVPNATMSWAPMKMINTLVKTRFPGTGSIHRLDNASTYGLRHLLESKGIVLPTTEEFCSWNPKAWEPYVKDLLDQTGRLNEGGTCRSVTAGVAAPTVKPPLDPSLLQDYSKDISAAIATCQGARCAECGTATCLTLLPTLQVSMASAMASAQAQQLWGVQSLPTTAEDALGLWGLNESLSPAAGCSKCVGELEDAVASFSTGQVPSCASLCLPLWASGQATYSASASVSSEVLTRVSAAYLQAQQAADFQVKAASQAEVMRVCVDPQQLAALQALINMATATRPLQTLLGIRMALRALGLLLPGNFAMMLGAFKGACVAKTVVPYSRVPGLILICAVVFSLPHLTMILVLVKSIIGDGYILVALLLFLFANMVYLPMGSFMRALPFRDRELVSNGLLEPGGHKEATIKMERRQNLALLFNLLMVVFLVVWFFASVPLQDFMELGLAEISLDDIRANVLTLDSFKLVGWNGVNIVTKLYGISKISSIFFFDASLYAILLIDEGDQDQKDKVFREKYGTRENNLYRELHAGLDPEDSDCPTKKVGRKTFVKQSVSEMCCCLRATSRRSSRHPDTE